jgi:5-methylcytosine-specific restriction endonuclease McrA
MCGAEPDTQAHDLHHIVPILAGGVNEPELLIELCRQCHETVEAYTHDLPGMQPVLAEEVAE